MIKPALIALFLPALLQAGGPALPSLKDVAKKVRPSVVNISIVKNVKSGGLRFQGGDPLTDEFFERFFGQSRPGMPEQGFKSRSLGSGVIIDAAGGYILTNDHVVEDADSIVVKLADKREIDAKVVGRDSKTDLAVIKLKKAENLQAAPFGDSGAIEVGDWVLAIGSPFGLEQTVSHGIISAKGRVIGAGPYDDFLQTDAPINPGNSGGPLVSLDGEVVGINTAITTRSGGSEGVGFAIPANLAKKIYGELVQSGHVTRGWLGVSIQDLDPRLAKHFGLPEGSEGAVVAEVMDGPARVAGLRQGDVITDYDGKKVSGVRELQRLVAETSVGKAAPLKVWREKAVKLLSVKVAEMKDEGADTLASSGGQPGARLGLSVRDLGPEELQSRGLKEKGALVEKVEPGSPAEQGGVQAGDIVLEAGKARVASAAELTRVLRQGKAGEALILRVLRGKRSLYLSVVPEENKGHDGR